MLTCSAPTAQVQRAAARHLCNGAQRARASKVESRVGAEEALRGCGVLVAACCSI
jgi:hypothetical protein